MGFLNIFSKPKLSSEVYEHYFNELMQDCISYLTFEKKLSDKLNESMQSNTLTTLLLCNPKMFFIDEKYRESILTKMTEASAVALVTRMRNFIRFVYTKYPQVFIGILHKQLVNALIKDIFKTRKSLKLSKGNLKHKHVEQLFYQYDFIWVIILLQYANMFVASDDLSWF